MARGAQPPARLSLHTLQRGRARLARQDDLRNVIEAAGLEGELRRVALRLLEQTLPDDRTWFELLVEVIAEADVAADPQNAAAEALALIGNAPYALHFDSDCIDFADLPICENTDRNVGLAHQTAFRALACAAAGPGLRAITITQITPYHGAADGSTISTFTDGLVTALTNVTVD